MIDRIRYIWQVFVLASVLVISGILILSRIDVEISLAVYLTTLASVAAINLIVYLIMFAGIGKNNREGMLFMMGGIGVKFLLYLLFILLFWILTKNISKPFILTFLTLYLIFTFFTAGHLLKVLKNK
jgi:hypothetical protein